MDKENLKRVEPKKELSMQSIQETLWDEIHNLKNGETTAANVQAITNASGKILSTVALQMKYAQLTGSKEFSIPLLSDK
jgi:hypothetical protein